MRQIGELWSVFVKYKKAFLLMTLTGVTYFNTFIYGALQFTSTSNVAVLEASIPVVTVIASAFLLKERLRVVQWAGVLISLLGAVWVVLDGRLFQLAMIDWNVGDAIMLGAVVSWATYSILVKKYMHHFPTYATLFVMFGISEIFLLSFVSIDCISLFIMSYFEVRHFACYVLITVN